MRYQIHPAAESIVAVLKHWNATEVPEVADVRQGAPQAGSLSRKIIIASLVLVALVAGATGALFRLSPLDSLFRSSHDNIADLQALPIGPVHLQGIVTYVDAFRKRFWIQDDTAAIAIEFPPTGIEAGQVVQVEARKTHVYNPLAGLASLALPVFELQAPSSTAVCQRRQKQRLSSLPPKEKNGIRVQLTGVIHYIGRDDSGLLAMAFGDSGYEA
jgi:hypothetical protein